MKSKGRQIRAEHVLAIIDYYAELISLAQRIETELRQGWMKVRDGQARRVHFFGKMIGTVELARKIGYLIWGKPDLLSGDLVVRTSSDWDRVVRTVVKAEELVINLMGDDTSLNKFKEVRELIKKHESK